MRSLCNGRRILLQFPPKDHAVEGILWYIQHHQLAGGDRLRAARAVRRDCGFAYWALRAYHAACRGSSRRWPDRAHSVCPPKPLNIFQETCKLSDAVRTAGPPPLLSSSGFHRDHRGGVGACRQAWGGCRRSLAPHAARSTFLRASQHTIETARLNLSLCPSLPEHDFECESLYRCLAQRRWRAR